MSPEQQGFPRPASVHSNMQNDSLGDWPWGEGVVATSDRVDKYGGFQMGRAELEWLVSAITSPDMSWNADHDPRQRLRVRSVGARLIDLPGERLGVLVEMQIHPDDQEKLNLRRGLSITIDEFMGTAWGPHSDLAPLKLYADVAVFDETSIASACEEMSCLAPVQGYRLKQFASPEEARIILELAHSTLLSLGPSIAVSAIYDGIKHLIQSAVARRRNRGVSPAVAEPASSDDTPLVAHVELVTRLTDGAEVKAVVETTDAQVVKEALRSYPALVEALKDKEESQRPVLGWRDTFNDWGLQFPEEMAERPSAGHP